VTKNTAWRFHEEGIRCNAILPGGTNLSPDRSGAQILINVPAIIDTNLGNSVQAANFDEASYQHQEYVSLGSCELRTDVFRPIHALHSQKPSITAMEVANTILFLASDLARAINGVALPIDKAWGVI
jgi:NAD(P)-dependent dehydrogenase (short-subunit alcohol dehydrogenase family)